MSEKKKLPPVSSIEAREQQLVSAAMDLVEKRLLDGSATSQETVHFLKIGSTKEKIEKSILEKQKILIEAKTEALQSAKRVEELYENAMLALKTYSGKDE